LSRYNNGDHCGPCSSTDLRGGEAAIIRAGAAEIGPRLRAARLRRGISLEARLYFNSVHIEPAARDF
jgi:hypothetical protein